jgi:hypothetical protein
MNLTACGLRRNRQNCITSNRQISSRMPEVKKPGILGKWQSTQYGTTKVV